MKEISVKVQSDHLERQVSVPRPVMAVAELIWNALDADATRVDVAFSFNEMSGLRSIRVQDNGHGIHYSDAVPAFENLGGSWKRRCKSKVLGRLLHGQAGKGRFRAFFLGDTVTWTTRFADEGRTIEFQISGTRTTLGKFTLTDPVGVTDRGIGTEVLITEIEKNFPSLYGENAIYEISGHFALYLRKYPGIQVSYDGAILDPCCVEELSRDYGLPPVELEDGRRVALSLTVIEWKTHQERAMLLCDANGFALAETQPGVHAPGLTFTAYLKSDYFRELEEAGGLVFEELDPNLKKLIDSGKAALRDHVRQRMAEMATDTVEGWKRENIYPYAGEPKNLVERTERQVFDVVALNVSEYLPDFEKANPQSRRFSLSLLRQAIEESPRAVKRIIQDVLDLPTEKREDLAELLERTTLTAIISAAKVVADRLDFVRGLEILLFHPSTREQLLERSQLHKILEEHTWLFGEEFALSVSDRSLTEVLRSHLRLLGRDRKDLAPVLRDDGSKGLVDLMLSRRIPQPHAEEREHLVVELKRPSQPVNSEVAEQIESYSLAVARDERFRDTNTRWVFWAVSNEVTDNIRIRARQPNRPEGLLLEVPEFRMTVWVKSWGQILGGCRGRLEFFQRHLEYLGDDESALATLRRIHAKYLPATLADAAPPGTGDAQMDQT